jgi:hypothetical protein
MEYWRIKIKDGESKRFRKTQEGKEYKKEMTRDQAAKVITKEINTSNNKYSR